MGIICYYVIITLNQTPQLIDMMYCLNIKQLTCPQHEYPLEQIIRIFQNMFK